MKDAMKERSEPLEHRKKKPILGRDKSKGSEKGILGSAVPWREKKKTDERKQINTKCQNGSPFSMQQSEGF